MITITKRAAEQIRSAAREGGMEGLALRIAARLMPDGGIDYGMGFDEIQEQDLHLTCEGIDVVISAASKELLNGATLDFVEIEPGDFRFIFMNPNDPAHSRPDEAESQGNEQ